MKRIIAAVVWYLLYACGPQGAAHDDQRSAGDGKSADAEQAAGTKKPAAPAPKPQGAATLSSDPMPAAAAEADECKNPDAGKADEKLAAEAAEMLKTPPKDEKEEELAKLEEAGKERTLKIAEIDAKRTIGQMELDAGLEWLHYVGSLWPWARSDDAYASLRAARFAVEQLKAAQGQNAKEIAGKWNDHVLDLAINGTQSAVTEMRAYSFALKAIQQPYDRNAGLVGHEVAECAAAWLRAGFSWSGTLNWSVAGGARAIAAGWVGKDKKGVLAGTAVGLADLMGDQSAKYFVAFAEAEKGGFNYILQVTMAYQCLKTASIDTIVEWDQKQ